MLSQVQPDDGERRDEGEDHQVDGARRRDAVDDVGQVAHGGLAGADAGDEAAVALHVVRDLLGVEGDGRVEEGEEQDEDAVGGQVDRARLLQVRQDPLHPLARLVAEAGDELGHGQDRGGEDDGDDAGGVDLDRDVGGRSAVLAAPDHPLGVLHGDAPLGLLDVHDCEGGQEDDGHDDGEVGRAVVASGDGEHVGGELGHDGGEDEQ